MGLGMPFLLDKKFHQVKWYDKELMSPCKS